MSYKLRPVLDWRMPTLGTRMASMLPIDDEPTLRRKMTGVQGLGKAPPKTLKQLRHTLRTEITAMQKRITRMERGYYGIGKNIKNYVDKYEPPIRFVMRKVFVFELCSMDNVDRALGAAQDPDKFEEDDEKVAMFQEALAKMKAYIPEKFAEFVEYCFKILETLERYCVSFYNVNGDSSFETGGHYEEQIQTWSRGIRKSLNNVSLTYTKFCDHGIHHSGFTPPVSAFCDKYNIGTIPFLVLFADACTNIKSSFSLMTSWLNADENYAEFLRNDIIECENILEEKLPSLRDSQQRYHALVFRLNQTEIELAKETLDEEDIRGNLKQLERDEEYILSELNGYKISLESFELRKEELRRNTGNEESETVIQKQSDICAEIKHINRSIPLVNRQADIVRTKLDWHIDKISRFDRLREEVKFLRSEIKVVLKDKQSFESQHESADKTLEVAKRIHLFKTANDAVERIYYNLPVGLRESKIPGYTRTDDNLDRGCVLVAELIDNDWVTLYRHLPFFPRRGSHVIEDDLSYFRKVGARDASKFSAAKCFERWRRHHNRATFDDLMQTCKHIKRNDIVHRLHLMLHPPRDPNADSEDIPPPVPVELIPFYRQVEKYDRLRKENKI